MEYWEYNTPTRYGTPMHMRYSYTYEIYLQDTATAPRYSYTYLELLTNTTTDNTKKYDASTNTSDVPVRYSRPLVLHPVGSGSGAAQT